MKAITVVPGKPDQTRVSDVAEPTTRDALLVEGHLLGICGTDRDIVERPGYGWPPPGRDRLVIGHESLGTVLDAAGADNPIRPGRGRPDVTTDLAPIDASGAGRIR